MTTKIQILLATMWLAALLTAAPAHAQWVNNPQNGMATVTMQSGQDAYPLVARLSSGYSVIIWTHYFGWWMIPKLKYQILDQSGMVLSGLEGQYLIDGDWEYGSPFLVPDNEGGAVCVFSDSRNTIWQIYGQRFDSQGNRLWGENGLPLATWTGGDMSLKDVETDSLGNIFLGWAENTSPNNRLFVQKITYEGQRLWGDYGACDFGGISSSDVQQIVPDEQGGVVDVWTDLRLGGSIGRLFAQHLDANGTPQWQENGIPVINPYSGYQLLGVVWAAVTDGQGGGIWVRTTGLSPVNVFRLTGTGQVPWLWTQGGADSYAPTALMRHSEDGSIWCSIIENGAYEENFLYRFDPLTGQQLLPPDGLRLGGETMTPVQGGVIVTEAVGIGVDDMQARRIANSGALVWQTYAVQSALAGGGCPAAVSNGADGAVVAFQDERNQTTDPDISAQQVLSNGRLGIPNPPHTPRQRAAARGFALDRAP